MRSSPLPLILMAALVLASALAAAAQDAKPQTAFGADGGIYTGSLDDSGRTLLLPTDATPNSVFWSPDGTRLAYVILGDMQHDIWLYDAETGTHQPLVTSDGTDIDPAWSPDGTQIAYASNVSGSYDLWLLDLACLDAPEGCASAPVNLTQDDAYDRSPTWSVDGEQLAFVSNRAAPQTQRNSIYLIQPDGSEIQPLAPEVEQNASSVAWSPDGRWLAYRGGGVDDIGTVNLIDVRGEEQRTLARGDISYSLVWAPDGGQIAYGCWTGHYYETCVVDADCGTTVAACTASRRRYDMGDISLISWRPES